MAGSQLVPSCKFIIHRGELNAEALTKQLHVVVIVIVQLIPGMEFHHPFRADAISQGNH